MVKPKNVVINHETEIVSMIVTCVCCLTNIPVELSTDEYHDYFIEGDKIQNAMPDRLPGFRELLISGTCQKCWNEMFPPDED